MKEIVSKSPNVYEKKEIRDNLNLLLRDIAKQINSEVSLVDNQDAPVPIVDEENRIEMRSFYTKAGGPYLKTQNPKAQDSHLINQLEEDFAHANDFSDSQKRLEQWREDREFDDAKLLESAVTILLHKALGSEYFVMKSTAYDDYINGVDTIVFSKYVGDIVCSFDEMLDSEPLLDKERYAKKVEQAIERNMSKGINIKYGLTSDIVSGQYIRTAVNSIPLMCLKVGRSDLHELLWTYNDISDEKTNIEITILKKLVHDIKTQKEKMIKKAIKNQVDVNVEEIDKLIEQLQIHF